MIAILALALMAPTEMRLPTGSMCPDAINVGGVVHVVYGDGANGWYTTYGSKTRIRINSTEGSVHAGGERGPKVAAGDGTVFAAWQGDYRQGPKAWFTRSTDGGKTFEAQRNLIQDTSPGVDHVAVAANGRTVIVLWLDGRGSPDPIAPVTTTIWYCLSANGGRTFGANQEIKCEGNARACSCCSFVARLGAANSCSILFRSGLANERDIWMLTGDPASNQWISSRKSQSRWVFEGCPMDGPRISSDLYAYAVDGKAYVTDGGSPSLLGTGRYANVVSAGDAGQMATWQEGETLHWRFLRSGESGRIGVGANRTAVVLAPNGQALIVH